MERAVAALAAIYRPAIRNALEKMALLEFDRARFENVDRAMFPVQYGNGESEAGRIDILRVSPIDCRTLAEASPDAPPKLAGVGLGHFSGFFKDAWRAQDILWGRLDGAERLVCTILSDDTFARRALILQAQVAILSQRDLDEVMDEIERGRPPEQATPPESRIEEMRPHPPRPRARPLRRLGHLGQGAGAGRSDGGRLRGPRPEGPFRAERQGRAP